MRDYVDKQHFVVVVVPHKGDPYFGPGKDVAAFFRLKRDAMALAEQKSQDDSVYRCTVGRVGIIRSHPLASYENGKRIS